MQTVEVKAVYVDTESRDHKKFKSPRYTLLTDDGERFSTFDSTIGRLLEEAKGKLIDVEIKENGGFKNIEAASPHLSSQSLPQRQRDPSDSRLIVRQVALKCAVELAAAGKIPMDSVRAYADRCVLWIYEQSEVTRMTPEGEEV
jgi:hypothetical protein